MRHRRQIFCIVGVLLAASTVYACCGMYPSLTVTAAPEPACVGEVVKIKGTISATESWAGSYSTNASVAVQVTSPSGVVMNLAVTLSNLQEDPGPPPSASWDYSAALTATEVGTYSYVVIGSWTTWYGTETTSEAGTFEAEDCTFPVDIKPTSCPNPLNVNGNGVLPVAILGTPEIDVTKISLNSIQLVGLVGKVRPIRAEYEDVAAPVRPDAKRCECTTEGPDGYLDLTLKFDTQAVVKVLGKVADGKVIPIRIYAKYAGRPYSGEDCVVIRMKGK